MDNLGSMQTVAERAYSRRRHYVRWGTGETVPRGPCQFCTLIDVTGVFTAALTKVMGVYDELVNDYLRDEALEVCLLHEDTF